MRRWAGRALGAFLTGLIFLLPFILTVAVLDWLAGYVSAAVGPDSFIGRTIASGGSVLIGGRREALAFWVGVALALVAIGALGLVVQTRFRKRIEGAIDSFIDRVPLLRSVYRPIAQLVRLVGPQAAGELAGMSVVACRFGGGADAMALLVTPEIFDIGGQPRQLVLVPTAPVPMGGALLFLPPSTVVSVPGMGLEDFVRFYMSMGSAVPTALAPVR